MKSFRYTRQLGSLQIKEWADMKANRDPKNSQAQRIGQAYLFNHTEFMKDFRRNAELFFINGISISKNTTFQQECSNKLAQSDATDYNSSEAINVAVSILEKEFSQHFSSVSERQRKLYVKILCCLFQQQFLDHSPGVIFKKITINCSEFAPQQPVWQANVCISAEALYINVVATHDKVMIGSFDTEELPISPDPFFVRINTTYKIEPSVLDGDQWQAKIGIASVKIQCADAYSHWFDDRKLLDKFFDWLDGLVKYWYWRFKNSDIDISASSRDSIDITVRECLSSNPPMVSSPYFFKSSADGKSVEDISATATLKPTTR